LGGVLVSSGSGNTIRSNIIDANGPWCSLVFPLHGVAGPTVGQASQLMHGHDAGVLQRAGQAGLAEEALLGAGIVTQLAAQDLDGQIALQGVVAAAIHFAHAADGDELVEHQASGDQRRRRCSVGREHGAGLGVGGVERIGLGHGDTSAVGARKVSRTRCVRCRGARSR
jgi:hypothetical protein